MSRANSRLKTVAVGAYGQKVQHFSRPVIDASLRRPCCSARTTIQLASASCMVVLAEQHERHLNVGGWPPTIWFVGKISKERAHAARDLLVTTK